MLQHQVLPGYIPAILLVSGTSFQPQGFQQDIECISYSDGEEKYNHHYHKGEKQVTASISSFHLPILLSFHSRATAHLPAKRPAAAGLI